jgi:hypothetical protein
VETTISLKVRDNKAIDLLKKMETDSLIEFINFNNFENKEHINKSDKYRGIFSKEDKISFDNHTNEMRKEWQNT